MARKMMRWLTAGMVVLLLAAVWSAYGPQITVLALDLWGPEFTYYDQGRMVVVKAHRLPDPPAPGSGAADSPSPSSPAWPEAVLRAACGYTLNLMGLTGPEGEAWTASMAGPDLVVLATWAPVEVGRFRVTGGSPDSGLAVVELDAGANGLHLMNLFQPRPDSGWFVVTVYTAIGVHP